MNIPAPRKDHRDWIAPTGDAPEPGYDAWLAEDIAKGLADPVAGRVIPAAKLRKELGRG